MSEKRTSQRHYLAIVGARPNFIKLAPLVRRLTEFPEVRLSLLHTGQHFDQNMSRVFFEEMKIPTPDFNLNITGQYHTEKIGKMFSGIKSVLKDNRFDGVIVFGDVNSTLAGAIASVAQDARVGLIHIEAGLRSHDRRMPEEINRAVVDHLSTLLFTTEPSAEENLIREGIDKGKIAYVGNIMIESIELFRPHFSRSKILESLTIEKDAYFVATFHRQENTDDPILLERICQILNEASKHKRLILPIHPGTSHKIKTLGLNDLLSDVSVIEPLGYFDFMQLMLNAKGVITDSGGIQEETSHLGVQCATLRDNTERPITLELGTNMLFPPATMQVEDMITHLLTEKKEHTLIPLWDDLVSRRILSYL